MKSKSINLTQLRPNMSGDEISHLVVENAKAIATLYPDDIPNDMCNTAVLSGIFYQNFEIDENTRFEQILSTQNEEVYIWKLDSNYFHFVSKVDSKVKELNIWDTFGFLLSLSFAWKSSFEHATDDIEYNWVYRFDSSQSLSELDFFDRDCVFQINNGVIVTKQDMQRMLMLVSLLLTNKKCLNSIISFNSSMQLSYCCLICELTLSGPKMHLSHEPKVWEKLSLKNNFETATLLAYKSVEHILGHPPDSKDKLKIIKFKSRWLSKISIEPDTIYEKTSKTYLEYYFYLLDIRNSSAHADLKNSFELERKMTIEAQCFAANILMSYINANLPSFEDVTKELKINSKLV